MPRRGVGRDGNALSLVALGNELEQHGGLRLVTDLDRHAALHAQTYGEAVDAPTRIPHMRGAFVTGDRSFKRLSKCFRMRILPNYGGQPFPRLQRLARC